MCSGFKAHSTILSHQIGLCAQWHFSGKGPKAMPVSRTPQKLPVTWTGVQKSNVLVHSFSQLLRPKQMTPHWVTCSFSKPFTTLLEVTPCVTPSHTPALWSSHPPPIDHSSIHGVSI